MLRASLFILFANALAAGEITGTLFDTTGAVISGARVMLMDQDYVKLAETKSGEQGEFAFKDVRPALYFVQAKKPRFQLAQQHVMLKDQPGRVHLIAAPGRGEDVITITSGLPNEDLQPSPPAPKKVREGGRIDQYRLVKPVMPRFPETARKRGASGTVVLFGTIRTDGTIGNVLTLESPDPELEKASMEAFGQWRFEPVKLNGVVIEATHTVIFHFR